MFKNLSNRALQNIKILDFSRVVAAPVSSQILGDLGAEVWKIERPGSGDESRSYIPPSINGQSCYFACVNRNKKSIALNLNNEEGQSIVSYGSYGPYANDPGYDVILEGVGGFMKNTGPINGEPCKAAIAVTDIMTGLYAHGAILAALYYRERTGRGQKIDCNLLSTQMSMMLNLASNYLNAGTEARPWGTEHESIVPYQAFETSDGRYYVAGAGNNAAFKELCKSMKLKELIDDPRYKSNKDRVENRETLIATLSKRFKEESFLYWNENLRTTKFPSGPVNSISEAFQHPQVHALKLVQTVTHPKYGSVKVVKPPVEYSDIENEVRSAAPLLGEHTVEILQQQLGFDSDTLIGLKQRKVIDFPEN
uniref:Uncharacterized protein n=1 Tax=Panagrolaimus davidi TaxID=227884 RepID=A0A914NXX7_9BILA